MKKYFLYLFLPIILLFPSVSALAAAPTGGCNSTTGIRQQNFKCLVGFATDIINKLVILLIGVGLLVFIWGLVKYITAAGDEEQVKEARRFIVFGLIAFFVMMSVWGLVNLIINTFFPGSGLFIPQFK